MDIDSYGSWTELNIAREHMTTGVPRVTVDASVGEVLSSLAGQRFDTLSGIAVCEGDRFAGLIDIEVLFASDPESRAGEVMDPDPPVVAPGVDQEVAAWRAAQKDESCLVVVDSERRFLGMIPPERIIAILLTEHQEDMFRLSGLLGEIAPARLAAEESITRRFLHRIPWLLVGMVGAFLAAILMGVFESQLAENVVVAFFVPSIVYLSSAVGVQSSTVLIRGLSVGVPIGTIFGRELAAGVLVGLAVSIAFYPIALIWWGDGGIALAVALSLAAACTVATGIGVVLPWVLKAAGIDPAFGSGPLATILQDLFSIVLYLSISSAVLGL